MKIVSTIARTFLALIFVVFGLNGFLHFIPMGPVPTLADQFVGALFRSHYMMVVFVLEIVCGLLLAANRYTPLALTLLAPVIVNIDLFHVFMAPSGLPMAVLVSILWVVLAYSVRPVFAGLFQHQVKA